MSLEVIKEFVTGLIHDDSFRESAINDFEGSTRHLQLDTEERAALRQVRDAYVAGGSGGVLALKNQLQANALDYWI